MVLFIELRAVELSHQLLLVLPLGQHFVQILRLDDLLGLQNGRFKANDPVHVDVFAFVYKVPINLKCVLAFSF